MQVQNIVIFKMFVLIVIHYINNNDRTEQNIVFKIYKYFQYKANKQTIVLLSRTIR